MGARISGGWYAPYWGPYWGYGGWGNGGYYANPYAGEVKLDTKVKDAQVFINGAYAGTTHENRSMHLRPGNYNIEIREGGRTQYAEKVYVVARQDAAPAPVVVTRQLKTGHRPGGLCYWVRL